MIKYDGRIVQFGFGAVGKSFFEKVSKEIRFDENKYFVITRYAEDFDAFIRLGGMAANFENCEITRDNFRSSFEKYLKSGDMLVDFADTVGTKDICDWCAEKNVMYLNTGDADWPERWLNIFEQSRDLTSVIDKHRADLSSNQHPIVLQHGANPGLVSHFVKAGIEYIVVSQHRKDNRMKALVKQNRFNELAQMLGIRTIHVNDVDLQVLKCSNSTTLYNTWCIDSFFFEMLSEASLVLGAHERGDPGWEYKSRDDASGFLELMRLAAETKCRTYYPNGVFDGYLIPHEETVSIAKSLEVKQDGRIVFRPTVMFIYSPCQPATEYFTGAKVGERSDIASQSVDVDDQTVVRGYRYPETSEIVYKEKIKSGSEYVGVLLLGENFDPVWVGNRVEPSFLYRSELGSYWQTPTITPVAMSALAAACWMIKNRDKRGVYFPEDIPDYKYIIRTAEKYISKTIYKTFKKETLTDQIGIDFKNLQAQDFFVQ